MLARSAIAMLLTMNLAVALWLWLREPPALAAPPALALPPLVLLSEREALPQPPPEAEADAPPEPLEAASLCLSLGPFETPADLRQVMARMQPLVSRVRLREDRQTQVRGFRVFLPALPTRDQALATARALAAKGVSDYYVVTAGDQENAVSLGLFRDQANAEQRQNEIIALGFDARLEARTEDSSRWWLDFAAAPDFDWRAHLPPPWPPQEREIDCAAVN